MNPYFLTNESFIANLKRAAKEEKRATNQHKHSFYLDKIAFTSGYQKWALLHKTLIDTSCVSPKFREIRKTINSRLIKAIPNASQSYIVHDLRCFLKGNYEKLAEFSVPNSSSDNGYSHQSIDLNETIIEVYSEIYPASMLQVAIETLKNEGPWCVDDSELIIDDFYMGNW